MDSRNFFVELRRRNVYKVAAAYAIIGWLIIQIATQVFPFLQIPNWAIRLVIMLIAIGFPIALIIAWAFELTPEGIKRTSGVERVSRKTKYSAWIFALALAALLLLLSHSCSHEPVFSKNVTGVLVMRIMGDDGLDSLQGDLVEKLNVELEKEPTGQRIEVHASSKTVSEKDGLKVAHDRARVIGQRLNAKIVIWGRKIGDKKFYPRLTVIVSPIKNWSAQRERTHDVVNITELQLPEELVDEPFYLIHFADGYSYYLQNKYRQALADFTSALGRKGALPGELADLEFFTGHCYLMGAHEDYLPTNLEGAVEHFEKAARIYEITNPTAYAITENNLGIAYARLRTGDHAVNVQKAMTAYDQAIRVNPTLRSPYYNRGSAYQDQGDDDKAFTDYSEAIRRDPKFVLAYINRSSVHANRGDYDKALADCSEAIRLDRNYPIPYNNRGGIYQAKGDYTKALTDFDQAIRLDPKYARAYVNRANVYRLIGDDTKGFADYDKAILLNSKLAIAYNNRGNAYRDKGDIGNALTDFDKAIQLDPEEATAYYNRGRVFQDRKEFDKALGDYDKAIRLDPKLALAYLNRGSVLEDMGDYIKSLADYNETIRIDRKNAFAYCKRASVYQDRGDYDKAMGDCEEAIGLDPRLALAYFIRGLVYQGKGDDCNALADFDEAIRLDPKDAIVYNNRGCSYQRKGNFDKASADFAQAIRLDAKLAPAYLNFAWLLGTCPQANFRSGKKAVEYASKACDLSKWEDARAVDTLAAAYAEAGDFSQAIRWEQQCLGSFQIPKEALREAKSRLALYQAHKSYREEGKIVRVSPRF